MIVKIKKLDPNAKTPVYGTEYSAGCDLFNLTKVIIKPHELVFLKTGISLEMPEGYFGLLAPRSSLCLKKHLDMPHSVGIFDQDYRGEYLIPLRNLGEEEILIEESEKIAQLVFIQYSKATFEETDSLSETVRGEKGFGSTGKI